MKRHPLMVVGATVVVAGLLAFAPLVAAAPRIAIGSPASGLFVTPGSSIARVSGDVQGVAAGQYFVFLNGAAVPNERSGRFSSLVGLPPVLFPSVTAHLRRGTDLQLLDGDRISLVRDMELAGEAFAPGGIALRLNQTFFDSLKIPKAVRDELSSSEDDPFFEKGDLVCLQACSAFDIVCWEVFCVGIKIWFEFGAIEPAISTTPDGLVVNVSVTDPSLHVKLGATAGNCGFALSAVSIDFSTILRLSPDDAGALEVAIQDADFDFPGLDLEIGGLCGPPTGISGLEEAILDQITETVIPEISDVLTRVIPPILEDAVNPTRLVGAFAASDTELRAAARLTDVTMDLDGLRVVADTNVRPGDSSVVSGPSFTVDASPPPLSLFTPSGRPYDVAVAVSASALNQTLKSALEAGALPEAFPPNPTLANLIRQTAPLTGIDPNGPLEIRRRFGVPPLFVGQMVDELPVLRIQNVINRITNASVPDGLEPLVLALDLDATLDLEEVEDDGDVTLEARVQDVSVAEVALLRTQAPPALEPIVAGLRDALNANRQALIDDLNDELEETLDPILLSFDDVDLTARLVEVEHAEGGSAVYLSTSPVGDPVVRGQNIDAVLVIDSSGSMGTNDPERRRIDASRAFLAASLNSDALGVVDFDDSARVVRPVDSIGGHRPEILAALDGIDQSGGTMIGRAVSAACAALDASDTPQRPKAAVLLTDGRGDYVDEASCFVERGWPIYTIALGNADDGLLSRIAEETGGTFQRLDDLTRLVCEFQRIRADIAGVEAPQCQTVHVIEGNDTVVDVVVDVFQSLVTFSTSWPGSTVQMTLTTPSGRVIDAETVAPDVVRDAGSTFESFAVTNPEPGVWRVRLRGFDLPAGGEDVVLVTTSLPRASSGGCAEGVSLNIFECRVGDLRRALDRGALSDIRVHLARNVADIEGRIERIREAQLQGDRDAEDKALRQIERELVAFEHRLSSLHSRKTVPRETRARISSLAKSLSALVQLLRGSVAP